MVLLFQGTDPTTWQMIERLGGWAVLVLILFWMTRRFDRQSDDVRNVIKKFGEAVETFRKFEEEERRTHDTILAELRQLRDKA